MTINYKIMSFRKERASELERMAQLLDKCIGKDVNTSSIYKAINELKNTSFIPTLKDGSRNQNIWGYDIEDFEMTLDTLKHVKPKDITKGKVYLSIKLRAFVDSWSDMNDPFVELGFNVFIKGIAEKIYHFGFHIDRHCSAFDSFEPHPIYHLHYNINPTESENYDSGTIMHLDTPRLLHYPLDFILGIGFLTSNFFPTAFNLLIDERDYLKLHSIYQERILKPYFHTLANHWRPFEANNITWSPINNLCPTFL